MKETEGFWKQHRRLASVLSIVAIVLGMVPYFMSFFQQGVVLNNTFLKKTSDETGAATLYVGKNSWGAIHIFVMRGAEGVARITYDVPENSKQTFEVTLGEAKDDRDIPVTITDEQTGTTGEWVYHPDAIALYDTMGEPDLDDFLESDAVIESSRNPFESFQPNRLQMVEIVMGQADVFRGNFPLTVAALLLFGATFVSTRWPLLVFSLRHMLDCANAEPSEFYLICQKVGQVLMPVLGGILLIAAMFVR